jgi:hydroxyacylglutathione hydrolase
MLMSLRSLPLRVITFTAFLSAMMAGVHAQAPQPDGGGVRPGVLPATWKVSGPECPPKPEFQIHEYNPDFYILR